MTRLRPYSILLVLLAVGIGSPVSATVYCCNDDKGRRICADAMPPECYKREIKQLNASGVVIKRKAPAEAAADNKPPEMSPDAKKQAERLQAEQRRTDEALMSSYASVSDIEKKWSRVLTEHGKTRDRLQASLDRALVRKQELAREAEFYAKQQLPEDLQSNIREVDGQIESIRVDLTSNETAIAEVQSRLEQEKQRYSQLTNPASADKSTQHNAVPPSGASRP